MFFNIEPVFYEYPYTKMDNIENTKKESKNVTKKCSEKVYRKLNEIERDFEKNIKEDEIYQNSKIWSREINESGARIYKSIESFDNYWSILNKQNLSKNNDHELFSSFLDHCVFTGIFFDVDMYIENKNSNVDNFDRKKLNIIKKIKLLIKEIILIMQNIKNGSLFDIIIQSSCYEEKISFHVLVKCNDIIFRNVYHIKVILLEAIYKCLFKYGHDFFYIRKEEYDITKNENDIHDYNNNNNNTDTEYYQDKRWLDLQVYKDNGTFRCLYNTKKLSPNRPFVILNIIKNIAIDNFDNYLDNNDILQESKSVMGSHLLDSLIFVPFLWLTNEQSNFTKDRLNCNTIPETNSQYIDSFDDKITNSTYQAKKSIEMTKMKIKTRTKMTSINISPKLLVDEKSLFINGIEKNSWFIYHLDSMRTGLSDFDEINKLVPNISSILSLEKENSNFIKTNIIKEQIADVILSQLLLTGNNNSKNMNYDKKIYKNKKDITPFFKKRYINKDHNAIVEYQNISNIPERDFLEKYKIQKKLFLDFLKSKLIKNIIFIYTSLNKYCYIKEDDHFNNHVYYGVNLVTKEWWQGCYDEECSIKFKKKQLLKYVERESKSDSREHSGLSKRTLGIKNSNSGSVVTQSNESKRQNNNYNNEDNDNDHVDNHKFVEYPLKTKSDNFVLSLNNDQKLKIDEYIQDTINSIILAITTNDLKDSDNDDMIIDEGNIQKINTKNVQNGNMVQQNEQLSKKRKRKQDSIEKIKKITDNGNNKKNKNSNKKKKIDNNIVDTNTNHSFVDNNTLSIFDKDILNLFG